MMRVLKPIVIFPGTALVLVPGLLLWASVGTRFAAVWARPDEPAFWIAVVTALVSLPLMIGTVRLFVTIGEGTPAPWDPPQRLVVRGPYRFVRNPMIIGVLLFLMAETCIAQSWPIACWWAFFFVANLVYFPLSEEKGLEKRFGDDYRLYRENVPGWIPRPTPWSLPDP